MIVLKATQEKVLGALQAVAAIVERRHTLPILANVLIRKTGEQTEFTTSDLGIQVRTRAQLSGDTSDFATTIDARKLIDILRAMPADQVVTMTASANRVTLKGGRSRFTLQTLPADDFPLVAEAADLGPAFFVSQSVLKGERLVIPPCFQGVGARGWCPPISLVDTYASQVWASPPPQ